MNRGGGPEVGDHAVGIDPVPRAQIEEQLVLVSLVPGREGKVEAGLHVSVEEDVGAEVVVYGDPSSPVGDSVDDLVAGSPDLELRQSRALAPEIADRAPASLLELLPHLPGNGDFPAVRLPLGVFDEAPVRGCQNLPGRQTLFPFPDAPPAVEVAVVDHDLQEAAEGIDLARGGLRKVELEHPLGLVGHQRLDHRHVIADIPLFRGRGLESVGHQQVEQQEGIPFPLGGEAQDDAVDDHQASEVDGEPPLRREVDVSRGRVRLPVGRHVSVEHVDDLAAVRSGLDSVEQLDQGPFLVPDRFGGMEAEEVDYIEAGVGVSPQLPRPDPVVGDFDGAGWGFPGAPEVRPVDGDLVSGGPPVSLLGSGIGEKQGQEEGRTRQAAGKEACVKYPGTVSHGHPFQ